MTTCFNANRPRGARTGPSPSRNKTTAPSPSISVESGGRKGPWYRPAERWIRDAESPARASAAPRLLSGRSAVPFPLSLEDGSTHNSIPEQTNPKSKPPIIQPSVLGLAFAVVAIRRRHQTTHLLGILATPRSENRAFDFSNNNLLTNRRLPQRE